VGTNTSEPTGPGSRRQLVLGIIVAAAIAAVTGFVISHQPTSHLASPLLTPSATLTPTPTEAPPDLSGTWLGTCSGASSFGCTFTLRQTDNGLEGTFIIQSPPPDKPLQVKGNLIGSAIALRSASGVVFTGTLSGATLSGVYISNGKTYSWSVTLEA
jgi:hypothetical protein